MTEIVMAGPPPAGEVEIIWKLAQRLSDTEFVPKGLQGRPNAVLAAILTGRELGIGPMQSLQSINVISGKPTLAPELMRALVARAGHKLEFPEVTDERCTIVGTRADSGVTESVTWTMADAKRAKLTTGAWLTYPRAMLAARATSELCRLLFADVIAGVSYTPEEIGGEVEPDPALTVPPPPETREPEVEVDLDLGVIVAEGDEESAGADAPSTPSADETTLL